MSARDLIENHLVNHPDASVDDVARALAASRLAAGITKPFIAEVRRAWRRAAPTPTPAALEVPMPAPAPATHPPSTVRQRREFVDEMLERNPGLHPDAVKTLLRDRFGQAVNQDYVYARCREAREENGLEQLPERHTGVTAPSMSASEAIHALADELKRLAATHGGLEGALTLRSGKVEAAFEELTIVSHKFEV